ncbi:hypothetical protein C8Q78DRAFT_996790 [Trametes maxima]|nr:hypothetical protein C8Q78DRAFT_996790 [Trametes maxima]
MEDINPSYAPRALKPIATNAVTPGTGHRPDKGKGKAKDTPAPPAKPAAAAGPLHKFFAPQVRGTAAGTSSMPASASGSQPQDAMGRPCPRPASVGAPVPMVVGKKSGKRTLAEVMHEDMAAKRKRHDSGGEAAAAAPAAMPRRTPTTSEFFAVQQQQRSVSDPRGARGPPAGGAAASSNLNAALSASASTSASVSSAPSLASSSGAGPSSLTQRGRAQENEKENVVPCAGTVHGDGNGDGAAAADVHMADPGADADSDWESDVVEQEPGYASPSGSLAQWDSPDISSPVRPKAGGRSAGDRDWDDDFDADVLSSPPLHRTRPKRTQSNIIERTVTRALPLVPLQAPRFGVRTSVSAGPDSASSSRRGERVEAARGPDLRDTFDDWDEVTSGDEDCAGLAGRGGEGSFGSTESSWTPGPETPADDAYVAAAGEDVRGLALAEDEGSSEEFLEEDFGGVAPIVAGAGCEREEAAAAVRANATAAVAHGWWAKWGRSGPPGAAVTPACAARQGGRGGGAGAGLGGAGTSAPRGGGSDRERAPLRRRETTMTPDGRQRPTGKATPAAAARGLVRGAYSAPQVAKRQCLLGEEDLRATGRTKLVFTATEDVRATPKAGGAKAGASTRPGSAGGRDATGSSRNRLEQFRWTPACR